MNCFSEFDNNSRSFTVQRDKSSTINIRRSNELWIERSKRESGSSWIRFKKNTTSSLPYKTCERSLREIRSRFVPFSQSQSVFDTSLWNDRVSRRPSLTHRRLVMSRAMWIDEFSLSMIWCRSVFDRRECFAKLVEFGEFRRGKTILIITQNVSWTSSSSILSRTPRFSISFL